MDAFASDWVTGTLADRTTRLDGVDDGTSPDGAAINLGYHYE